MGLRRLILLPAVIAVGVVVLPALIGWWLEARWLLVIALGVNGAGALMSAALLVSGVRYRGGRAPSMGPGLGAALSIILGTSGALICALAALLAWSAL